jgi:hypothetical protein
VSRMLSRGALPPSLFSDAFPTTYLAPQASSVPFHTFERCRIVYVIATT